jgi:hypothetical protein
VSHPAVIVFLMSTNTAIAERPVDRIRTAAPTQLSLLTVPAITRPPHAAAAPAALPTVLPDRLPPKLRVSARTRTVGRTGIAEARAILAEQAARRAARGVAA